MISLDDKINGITQLAFEQGLHRQRVPLTTRAADAILIDDGQRKYINFSSNDYLSLSRSPQLIEALIEGARIYGVGGSSSPLVTGYSAVHEQLESLLCKVTGHQAALLFCSGFSANSAVMKTLFDKDKAVVADRLIHASLIDGLCDSSARLKRFAHNDLTAANEMINRFWPHGVITESVFSMDGDRAPLTELYQCCQTASSWFIVDDAHGFGLLPPSDPIAASADNCDVQIITFGKALGCQGGAVLGTKKCIDFLVSNARHYIYSTALSPACAYVATKAVELVTSQPELAVGLASNIEYFRRRCQENNLSLMPSNTAIQPIVIDKLDKLTAIVNALKEAGIWVTAIRPPTVPRGSARLRITINLGHTKEHIDHLVTILSKLLQPNYKPSL